jgi:hypothetical protein
VCAHGTIGAPSSKQLNQQTTSRSGIFVVYNVLLWLRKRATSVIYQCTTSPGCIDQYTMYVCGRAVWASVTSANYHCTGLQTVAHRSTVHSHAVHWVTTVVFVFTSVSFIQRLGVRTLLGAPNCDLVLGSISSTKLFSNHLLSCARVDLVLRTCSAGSGVSWKLLLLIGVLCAHLSTWRTLVITCLITCWTTSKH